MMSTGDREAVPGGVGLDDVIDSGGGQRARVREEHDARP
jgi:hypothetical protein